MPRAASVAKSWTFEAFVPLARMWKVSSPAPVVSESPNTLRVVQVIVMIRCLVLNDPNSV